jgi:hypothetical protein
MTTLEGSSSGSLTSAATIVYERPPEPSWGGASSYRHCAAPVCMEALPDRGPSYRRAHAWWTAYPIQCSSAPWTSAAGDSGVPEIRSLAEAHTVRVSLERIGSSGALSLASVRAGDLDVPRFPASAAPFGDERGLIVVGYGSQPYVAGESFPDGFTVTGGLPNEAEAAQGSLIYFIGAASGHAPRSFSLIYHLTAADLGAKLRCVVEAEDGPPQAATTGSYATEATISSSPACQPRPIASASARQPYFVRVGTADCLSSSATTTAESGSLSGIMGASVGDGVADVVLECGLPDGCSGRLSLFGAPKEGTQRPHATSHGHSAAMVLATLRARVAYRARRMLAFKLNSPARRLLARAGRVGVSAVLRLQTLHSSRDMGTLRLAVSKSG